MIAIESPIANEKFMPIFNNIGNTTKNKREGRTAQKMPLEREMTFSMSFVSMYNQIIASIEIRGSEANIAATQLTRLAISDVAAIITPDNAILIKNCILYLLSKIPPKIIKIFNASAPHYRDHEFLLDLFVHLFGYSSQTFPFPSNYRIAHLYLCLHGHVNGYLY